jgi:hypothetical protein
MGLNPTLAGRLRRSWPDVRSLRGLLLVGVNDTVDQDAGHPDLLRPEATECRETLICAMTTPLLLRAASA